MAQFRISARRALLALLAGTTLATGAIAATVTGTVADSTGVRPLSGAEVRINSLGRVTNADPAGRFRFSALPAGTYEITARFAGAGEQTQTVTVGADGTMQVNFVLAPEGTGIETILVLGQQATLLSSIQRQRASDTVTSVLTRDAIGQFPDQNVAESIRRAPGINILNDQGEGRFVVVRGLDPNLNAASINGVRVPSPEADVRSVALDVIPNELVESIEIKKSLTPDMDGDTIGGSIEINTTSAFDREKGFVTVSAEGSYNDLSGKFSPKGSVDFSHRLGEDFGIAGGLSYYKRRFSTDNVEMDGWEEGDNGIVYAEDAEYRDYDVERERIGATLSFDWRASDTTELYARGLFSEFSDQEYRRRLVFDFGDFGDLGGPTGGSATTANFQPTVTEIDEEEVEAEIGVERDLKDRFERQRIQSYTLGGKTETGPWSLTYSGSYSQSEEQERDSDDPIIFARDFAEGELDVTFDYSRLIRPAFTINAGASDFTDASGYEFDELERTTVSDATDREWALKGDVARELALSSGTLTLQGGMKARWRTKEFNGDFDIYDGFDGDFTLADVVGRATFGFADIDPVPGGSQWRDFLDANGYDAFERNDTDSFIASNGEDYRAKEDILAGYVLGRYEGEFARVIAGVRVERTRTSTRGNVVNVTEEEDENGDDVVTVTADEVQFDRSYTDWLPSVNLRADAGNGLILRAAAYRSVVRPNFADFAPRFVIEDGEANFGNPDLDPYRAWNFDLGVEWYFAPKAVVQAGFFAKSISDYIVTFTSDEGGEFNGIEFDELETRINGDRASVVGLELAYTHALTGLPAPFDGLLVNLNYTFTDARVDVPFEEMTRRVALPGSSKHNFNAVLGYDKGPLSFRIAGAFRDGYLDELSDDAGTDRFVKSHFQLDLSAKYRITDQFTLFGELVNLNNARYTAYQKGPGGNRLLQHEEYRLTAKFGVKASF
jgi:TonB-dependent receptor